MHVLSKLWSLRSEPPRLPKHDYILIEDTSMNPISFEDENSSETFADKTRSRDRKNLLSDTDTTSIENLEENKKAQSGSSNNEQLTIKIGQEENTNTVTTKNMSFINNNNENNSVGELDDVITPSIKRGFYGLEDIMVRRQNLSIKKFVDKSVQVGNGWIRSHDFASQTSFIDEEKNDINLEEYLKSYSDESYHSDDVSNDRSKTIESQLIQVQIENENYLDEKESDDESLSNSDMSIDSEQEPYQGNENSVENLADERETQTHVQFSESCDSNTIGLIVDDKEPCDKVNSNAIGLIIDDNHMTISPEVQHKEVLIESNNNVKNTKGFELERESPIFKVPKSVNGTTQTIITPSQIKEKKKVHIISPNITDSEELGTISVEQKENSKKICYTPAKQRVKSTVHIIPPNITDSEELVTIEQKENSKQKICYTPAKQRVKSTVHTISPNIVTDSEELVTIEQKEILKQKICYTPAKQRVKSTLATPVMNSERSICTPGTINSNYSFRVTHDTLTKLISEVEPDQTHWKEMCKIDLNTKNIESLNHLSELMPKLKELDLNNNLLRYLTGTPASLTTLQVSGNRLTSLTSFAHLPNLEYLDISQNRIETLTDLHRLEHLREVFADDNLIACCYSVLRISGLVKLSLRKNKLKSVNFESSDMCRLELLDLSENKIELIENVERLIALKALNLDHNLLRFFSVTTNMPQLTCLRLCYNKLSELDVSPFPNLRLLWVDENRLKTIKRSETLAFLETFSARDQKGGEMHLPLKHLRDFKHIYLSGNPIKTLEPIIDFYKLEYLELAAAHIKELPHKLNRVCPSIIVLILSYNELRDFTPLRRMKRLRRLFLEGNQIYDYMAFSEVLKTLPKLKYLDIRNNPFSKNFYPTIPAIASSLVHQNSYAMHRDPEEEIEWGRRDEDFKQNLDDQWFVKRCFYRYDVFRRCPNIGWLDGTSIDSNEKELGSDLLNVDTAKILKSA
ncbi:hypothetical protein C1645_757142 [Glomus cerebriforme]|uniref:L domain-like protein n=1 Tax=Glomus cerebriforme TaxID=658196 RepID=A0A397TGL8_9GLOM|nr:hypothetical protein C1645_757142 [Glomus cerebriforme]